MSRQMLVIHESELLRKIISSYALAELSDVVVQAAPSPEEGLKRLEEQKFDVVLCALEMTGMDGFALRDRMGATKLNQDTPLVMTASPGKAAQEKRLADAGPGPYLVAPYTAADLARAVDQACHPSHQRSDARHSIPGTKVLIHLEGGDVSAPVLNVSRHGLLCELVLEEGQGDPMKPARMDILFPEEYGGVRVEGLRAAILHLNVMTWGPDHVPETLRAAWKFVEVPAAAAEALETVLERAGRDFSLTSEVLEAED